jgi:hypothetical protein
MIAAAWVASWGASTIRPLGAMTIPAAESDPDTRELASDAVGGDRWTASDGELRLVAARECADARPVPVARRLRTAPSVQLELVCDREGPRPEVVWASLPERSREQVLVLLARLIDVGAVAQEGT